MPTSRNILLERDNLDKEEKRTNGPFGRLPELTTFVPENLTQRVTPGSASTIFSLPSFTTAAIFLVLSGLW
jgi:hypothetical protein